MRKIVLTAALGILTVATAADAHVGAGPSPCEYGAADWDTYLEVARLEPLGEAGQYSA